MPATSPLPQYSPDVNFTPFWWHLAPRPNLEPPALPAAADVAVVGSGYTGLSAALVLARGGRTVAVFDAEDLGWGASTRNGGVVGSRMKISFSKVAAERGPDVARSAYRECINAHDFTIDLIQREGIDCNLVTHGRFMGARTTNDFDAMRRDADFMAKELGLNSVVVPRSEQHAEVGTDLYHGGIIRPKFGGLHPGLFHQGLLDRVRTAGATLLPRTRVEGIERYGNGFHISTGRGRVKARDVVVATNGYTGPVTPWLRRRIIPIPSQIIVTEPLGAERMDRLLPKRRMMGDSSKLHHYYRPSPDGLRIMFGGRAGATYLYGEMIKLFPEISGVAITHSWSGNTGYTFDTMAHVGMHDGMHFAMGFCGSGVAMGTFMGAKLGRRILGAADGQTAFDVFPFPTRPLYSGKPWFLPVALAYYGLRDRLGR